MPAGIKRLQDGNNTLSVITLLPPFQPVDKSTDYQNYYQGIWDCVADHPDELSFKRGDAIYVLSKVIIRGPCMSDAEHWFVPWCMFS